MSTSVSDSPLHRPDGIPAEQGSSAGRAESSSRSAKRDRITKRVVTVVSGLLLMGILFLVIRVQGHVSGIEFTPTHFQQRRFSFFEIPLIHLQITPIRRSANTPRTANYLRLNSLIASPSGVPTTWHLVSISRGWTGSTPADANLLATQLRLEHAGDDYWRTWSIDHPQRAKVFWPVVQNLATRELYILMPPLFEIAQNDQTPDQLQAIIDARLRADLASLVEDLRGADRAELADQILTEALKDYPGDGTLQNLRAATN